MSQWANSKDSNLTSQYVRARVNHSAARYILVDIRILASIELVHHHLPDRVRSGGAALQISVATVRHAEVHCVRPEWRIRERRGDS